MAVNAVKRFQDQIARRTKSVFPHPPDFTDPDRHESQFSRKRIYLDAEQVLRPNRRKAPFNAQRPALLFDRRQRHDHNLAAP